MTDLTFHSLVPNAELESLRRDAARWRAIEPHMQCGKVGESSVLSMASMFHYRGQFTAVDLVDKLVAEKEKP